MANSSAIRAGRAFVEIYGDNSGLVSTVDASRAKVKAFGQEVADTERKIAAAQKAGATAGVQQLTGSLSGLRERQATAQQELAGRIALRQRLASRQGTFSGLEDYDFGAASVYSGPAGSSAGNSAGASSAKMPRMARRFIGGMAGETVGQINPALGAGVQYGMMAGMMGLGAGMAVGIGAVAAAFVAVKAAIDDAQETTRRWNELLSDTRQTAEKIDQALEPKAETTGRGQKIREAIQIEKDHLERVKKAAEEESHSWGQYVPLLVDRHENLQRGYRWAIGGSEASLQGLKESAELEERIARERKEADQVAEVEAVHLSRMADGPAKALAELAHKQAEETRKAFQENGEKPGSVSMFWLDAKHREERLALSDKFGAEDRKAQTAAQEARINATQTGFARELALLQLKHRTEREEAEKSGRDLMAIFTRQTYEEIAIRQKAAEAIAGIQRGLLRRIAVAVAKDPAAEKRGQDWEDIEKRLGELGATREQVSQALKSFTVANMAEDEAAWLKTYKDQMQDLNIQFSLATGKITEWDAAMLKLQQHSIAPGVPIGGRQREELDEIRQAMEKTDLAKFARGELEGLKTAADKFKEYRDRVEKAASAGLFTPEQKAALLANRMAELMGRASVAASGTFNPAEIRGLGSGPAIERLVQASEETADNTEAFSRIVVK